MKDVDVTKQVEFNAYDVDGECLPITKCVCGKKYRTWDAVVGIYKDQPYICEECGVKLYFSTFIRVFKIVE